MLCLPSVAFSYQVLSAKALAVILFNLEFIPYQLFVPADSTESPRVGFPSSGISLEGNRGVPWVPEIFWRWVPSLSLSKYSGYK